ncbi:Tm-1-like ATP-binding domain-containing protein [Leptolinea tardivitalis]|uniref:Uncharacterized protein n=1 Tax=Leptolinea tardivitalis TaxID=229920 RepID=A0A0P6X0P8_9CHLR|nr:Tm-1-like ATP-binding domain-containing protein [Leptolinea tardivitalis]KPL72748.1 hypothetical protein ADM99_06625 [Leptolinea tardivitalis]GAP20904.1 uncharacterized conserved protein [Leptolinea tardivitalis]
MIGNKTVIVIGTVDTKGPELDYLRQQVKAAGCEALLMDVGVHNKSETRADITGDDVVKATNDQIESIRSLPRGEAVEKMSNSAAVYLAKMVADGNAHGVIGLGGSGGTTICAAAMRGLPYGLPKLLVSTLASGNTRWHIGISDIVMMPSILDIGGLNPMLQMVLKNAAGAIAGMVNHHEAYIPSGKPVVTFTMYGTTTPGVSATRKIVEDAGFEPWVFHASGVGGKTMERMIDLGYVKGVVDMTLAEIGAHLIGGLHDAGPERLDAAGKVGIPQLIVPGAADTVVLPPRDQIPEKFKNRILNFHNPTMTTMRTEPDENRAIGEFIARKLNASHGPVKVLFPWGGLSSIDHPGKIFYLPEANKALFETLKINLKPEIELLEDDHHLDDPEFAQRAAGIFLKMIEKTH